MSDAPPQAELAVGLCGPAERAEQARLFCACFKKGASAEDLAWRYDRGPHGASISLLARPAGGDGVSGYACSPRRALVRGDETTLATVGQTGDVMTHPDWRKRGIFSDLDRRAMQEAAGRGWALAFGLPNRRSAHIFEELGWETVGSVRPWSFYLAADAAARAHALREGRWRALTLGWRVRRCARARARLLGTGFRSQALARVPPEVLALARQVEPRFGFMVRRDADYLNWRYLENPAGLHEVHGTFDGARLAALVVVQRPRAGERVGYLVDLLAPELHAQAAAPYRPADPLSPFFIARLGHAPPAQAFIQSIAGRSLL